MPRHSCLHVGGSCTCSKRAGWRGRRRGAVAAHEGQGARSALAPRLPAGGCGGVALRCRRGRARLRAHLLRAQLRARMPPSASCDLPRTGCTDCNLLRNYGAGSGHAAQHAADRDGKRLVVWGMTHISKQPCMQRSRHCLRRAGQHPVYCVRGQCGRCTPSQWPRPRRRAAGAARTPPRRPRRQPAVRPCRLLPAAPPSACAPAAPAPRGRPARSRRAAPQPPQR